MEPTDRLSRSPFRYSSIGSARQRVGHALGHAGRRTLGVLLGLVLPVRENRGLDAIGDVRRVLLVRPNFRMGNTLITAPLILALRARFARAEIDVLTGDTTASLLAHLPVRAVHQVSRGFITRPWRFVALFLRLRRRHYDIAVEAGFGSFSGALYTYFTGARFRIGCTGKGDHFLNVRLPPIAVAHMYDSPAAFSQLMGADCPRGPVYVVGEDEQRAARAVLADMDLVHEQAVLPFVALLVVGHLAKRWPADNWFELAYTLTRAGARVIVCLGPEQTKQAGRVRQQLPESTHVLPPQPVRLFAAICAQAALVVTSDSGPMHLAAALGVPTVALLQIERSRRYSPRGAEDVALMRSSVAEVVEAIIAHPRWRSCCAP